MGWIANILLCYQWWALGHKKRLGLLAGVIAGILWSIVAIQRGMYDLLFIETLLSVLQLRAWIIWGRDRGLVPTDCPICSGASEQQ